MIGSLVPLCPPGVTYGFKQEPAWAQTPGDPSLQYAQLVLPEAGLAGLFVPKLGRAVPWWDMTVYQHCPGPSEDRTYLLSTSLPLAMSCSCQGRRNCARLLLDLFLCYYYYYYGF